MDRKQRQAELIYKVGLIFRPLEDLFAASPGSYTQADLARLRSQFHLDHEKLLKELEQFCKEETGLDFSVEFHDIQHPLANMNNVVRQCLMNDLTSVRVNKENFLPRLLAAIAAVPVETSSMVFDAKTPFTTYCRIRELVSTAAKQIVFVDRYVDENLFCRYFHEVSPQVSLCIGTWPRANHGNKAAYDSFLDASRLFAVERGNQLYRLVEIGSFHDRMLRIDDQLYHLGGSAKDAGGKSPFTISKMEPTPANFQKLDALIGGGTELFGPSTPTHA